MTQNLNKFLSSQFNKKYATANGTSIHLLLKNTIIDKDFESGDKKIICQIKNHTNLIKYFSRTAKTEVPIAGLVHGTFVSRRIDRMLIDDTNKTIEFIDYKTDTNKSIFIEKYIKQLNEYAQILYSAYSNYKINGYILWIQDWQLQPITSL